ncbi:MAG: Ig-like domain-containing protein [Vicinamibacterales bacterium]
MTFSIGGVDIVTDSEEPYEVSYLVPADAVVGQPLTARARARDFAGNPAESTVSIDIVASVVPVPPQITLTVPPTAIPGDQLTLSADATDLDGIASVVFTQGLAVLASDTTAPYSTTFTVSADAVAGSTITFKAEATDLTDAKASDTKTVSVLAPPTLTRGVVTGEVYEDTTSLPVADVNIALTGVDRTGVPYTETAVTDARGRFVIRAVGGTGVIRIEKSGWTRADRRVLIAGGQVVAMLDARLTRLGPSSQSVSFASGGTLTSGGSTVTFGPGIVPPTPVRFAALTQQGLEGQLPTGWTPVAAADLFPHDVMFNGAASLKIRRLVGTAAIAPQLARWDAAASQWRLVGPGQLTADGLFLQASVTTAGQFAFVQPDVVPVAPSIPGVGGALAGVGEVTLPSSLATVIAPTPKVLFYEPGVGSDVRSTITPQVPVSSGAVVAARLTESYRFLSGATAAPESMTEDLIAFQDGSTAIPPLVASTRVTPSLLFETLTLEQGVIGVEVLADAANASGQVALAAGGEFTAPGGQSLVLPPGAVGDGAVVAVTGLTPADLGVTLPSGIAFLGGARISSSDAFARAGTFSVPAPPGLANLSRILLIRSEEIKGQTRAVLVGVAKLVGDRLTSETTIGGKSTSLEGVRQAGRYGFIQADGPIGFAGGLVSGVAGQPAGGALVTSSTFFVVSLSNAAGGYLAAAPATNTVMTATDLARNDYVTAPAFLLSGQVLPLALAMTPQPPRVTSVSPVNGTANVALGGPIVVTFSEPIDPDSIGGAAVTLSGPGNASVDIARALSQGGTVLTVRPASALSSDTHYAFALTSAVKDLSGYGLAAPLSIAFDSIDTSAPLPPAAGSLSASLPNAQGLSTVAGTQGTASPTDRVFVDNLTSHISAVALVQGNGGFSAQILARITDTLQVRIVDAAGNETKSALPAFKTVNGDGSVSQAVTALGGIIEGPNGSQAKVKPGTFPNGAVVTINYVAPAEFPIQLGAEFTADYTIDGGISVDFGGQTPQLYVDLSIPPRGGETDATRWIVVAAEEVNGQLMMNAIDTAKFRGDRITTASPPCPGVQAARTYGFVRSRQTVGLSYSNVFVGAGKGLLMGLKWEITGGPFGLMPFGVHADPFAEVMCYPVLTGNVTLIQNAVRVSIPATLLTPADRQLILTNKRLSLPPNKVPRDVQEFTYDVEGETSDSFRIEAKGNTPTDGGAPATQLLTKFTISNFAPGRVRLRIDPDPVNIVVQSIEIRNLTKDLLSVFTQTLTEPFTAAGTGGNGDPFEVTVVDVLGRTRKLEQQYPGSDSLYGDGNLVLKAVEASIDPTREEMNAAGVGGRARTAVSIADLTQLGVFQPVPAAKIVRGGIKGFAFHGDPTHDFAIIVNYDQGGDYTQRLPRMQIDVRNAQTGAVLKTIEAFAPPPDEPLGLPDITDGDTRAPYIMSGPNRLSNFDPSGQLVFTFSEAMNPDSVKNAFEVKDSAGRILEGVVEVSGGDRVARFVPAAALRSGEQYTVRIKGYSPAQGANPGSGGGSTDAARDRRGNPVAEISLIVKVFTPRLLASYTGDGNFGVFKDVVVPPPAPVVVDPNPNQPGPGNNPADQSVNSSRPVFVTTSHQTFNLLSLESRDPAKLSLLTQKEGPISRQQGAFIRNVAFTKAGIPAGGVFSGDLLLTTTFNTNSSRLDWYDVTRRNNVDTFDLLSSKVLTENPDLAGFGNRNNTIFAEGALAKGVGILSGATGVTGYVAVERVGVLSADLALNTPFRPQIVRIKEGVYPGDFLDLAVADGKIFTISRTEKQLHVLDAGLGALAVRQLQVNGKSYTPRKIKVRTDVLFDKNHDGSLAPDEKFNYAFIAADQAVLMVDVTDPTAPQVTGLIPMPGTVRDIDVDMDRRRAFVTGNGALVTKIVNGVATQVDGYVAMLDVADPTNITTIDINHDGLDDRIIWQEGAPGVNGIRIDPFRGVLFVAGGTLDTYAVYDLCCDLGVDLAPKPTATVTGDRLTLAKLEKQAVANGLATGIGNAASACSIQPTDLKLLDLGSGSCLWTSTDACGSDYKPGLGSHDIAVFVAHDGLLVNAPGADSGGSCAIKELRKVFVDPQTGLRKDIDVDGLKVKVENITFAAYHLSELAERAQYNVQIRDTTLPGETLADFGLGRQSLLMSHVLGGAWVTGVTGYGKTAFAGPVLNDVMAKLRHSRNLPIIEGFELTRLAQYQMAKNQVYIRFPGASSESSYLHTQYLAQIVAAASAGIKAALGRLIVDVNGRDRLLAVTLDDVAINSTDSPIKTYGANGCLAIDPAAGPADWKEVACSSFDHFVASVAAGTRREWGTHPALDGSKPSLPELFDLDRASQVMRFYRVGAGFEVIQSEADADAFIKQVDQFITWADDIARPFYENRILADPQYVQRVQNRLHADGGITQEMDQASFAIVPRIFNKGFGRAEDIALDMFVTRPGASTPSVPDVSVKVNIDAGTEQWSEYRRHSDGTLVLDATTGAAAAQFSVGPVSQSLNPGVLGWVAFAIDVPAKKQKEADRSNNVGGTFFYMLDRSPASQTPGTGGRVPSPVGDAALTGDDTCDPEPGITLTQGLRRATTVDLLSSPVRLDVGDVAGLEVQAKNNDQTIGKTVTLCNTLDGTCQSLGTIPAQGTSAVTRIPIPTAVPATYDIITTAYSSTTGVQRLSPFRVTIACTQEDFVPLSHDPSLASEVMRSGTTYRYFQLVNHKTGKPVANQAINVLVTGDRHGTFKAFTNSDGMVGMSTPAFTEGIAIPFDNTGAEGTARVTLTVDRGATTECLAQTNYTILFKPLKTTHTMSLGVNLEGDISVFVKGSGTIGPGMTFSVDRTDDKDGTKFGAFTLGRSFSVEFTGDIKAPLTPPDHTKVGFGAVIELQSPEVGVSGTASVAVSDTFTFSDLQNLTDTDKRAIATLIVDGLAGGVPSTVYRFVRSRMFHDYQEVLPRRATFGVSGTLAISGAEKAFFRVGFQKNQDIPDGTGTSVVGGELLDDLSGSFGVNPSVSVDLNARTLTAGLAANGSLTARAGVGLAANKAKELITGDGAAQKKSYLDTFVDGLFGSTAVAPGLGLNGALNVSVGAGFTFPNKLGSLLFGTPLPTDTDSLLATSAFFNFSEAGAYGYRAIDAQHNAGAGSKYTYSFTASGKDFYKRYVSRSPFAQTLLLGNQRFSIPGVSQPSGPVAVGTTAAVEAGGAFLAASDVTSKYSKTVEYGNGIDFAFGAEEELFKVGGGIFLNVKTNQSASYPVEQGVYRYNRYWPTEKYPLGLVEVNSWQNIKNLAKNYTDPIVLRYVTKGNITPVPGGNNVDVPGVAGLLVANADDATSVQGATAVPFVALDGPTAPTRRDAMGVEASAGQPHFGVNGFVEFNALQPNLTAPAHLTLHYTDDQVTPAEEATLGLYRWVASGADGSWVLVPSTIDRVANTVEADVTVLGSFTLAPRLPSGGINWTVLSANRAGDPNSPTTTVVFKSAPILNNDGTVVPAGTIVHVRSLDSQSAFSDEPRELGVIQTPDADPLTDGAQLVTDANGQAVVQVQIVGVPVSSVNLESFTEVGVASSNQTVVVP